ncbi:hypothetical protein NP493_424g02022 [Ridgeia piscesae]|uniref:Uncharacterized protein n=1 Tax=Ridgeia piscesae TaxID=27915 RepID=A0AAD9NS82_RIDPI|nr:hypothetical protein NP493_424g02022 [Ridgeia piscesae]
MKTGRSPLVDALHIAVLLCLVMVGHTGSDVIHRTLSACTTSHGNYGSEATCSGDSVISVPLSLSPRLVKLKITNTSLVVLEKEALSHLPRIVNLDLSGNRLTNLKPGCFRGLSVLRYLNIAYNRLCFGDDAFPVGVFNGMTSLRTLTMHSNLCPSGHVDYPDKALGQLSALETLAMNGLPDVPLGPGFAKITSLRSLELSGKHCHLGELSRRTFTSLTNTSLRSLSVRACDVSRIDRRALTPLSSLDTLNLACNEHVGWKNAVAAVGAATTTRLDTLILDNVNGKSEQVGRIMFDSATFRSVRRFSFRANSLICMDVRAVSDFPMVRSFALGYNPWDTIIPRHDFLEVLNTVTSSMTLDVVDIGDFTSSSSDYRRLFCEPDHVDTDAFFRDTPTLPGVDYSRRAKPAGYRHGANGNIPLSALVLHADNAHYKTKTFTLGKLEANEYSDMVFWNLSFTAVVELKGPLTGLNRLQVFDASHCRIRKVHSGALGQLRQLKYLFLQYNVIGEDGDALGGQFLGLRALLRLDLSHNRITTVDRDAFRDLGNLTYLSLRGNRLSTLGFDVASVAAGVTVDVSSNPVVSGQQDVAGECELRGEWTEEKPADVTLVCACSDVTFIYRRRSTGVSVSLPCVNASRDEAVSVIDDRVRGGRRTERVNIVVGAVTVTTVVVIVVASVVVVRRFMCRRRQSGRNVFYASVKSTVT